MNRGFGVAGPRLRSVVLAITFPGWVLSSSGESPKRAARSADVRPAASTSAVFATASALDSRRS
jgi:hypothetical protein